MVFSGVKICQTSFSTAPPERVKVHHFAIFPPQEALAAKGRLSFCWWKSPFLEGVLKALGKTVFQGGNVGGNPKGFFREDLGIS